MMNLFNIIKPPGDGLLTITSGSKINLDAVFSNQVKKNWKKEILTKLKSTSPFYFIGIPSDMGGGICRGAALGPHHLRHYFYKKNKSLSQYDLGDIPCIPQLLSDELISHTQKLKCGKTLWGSNYKNNFPVSPLNLLKEFILQCYNQNPNFKPFVLGGDHSVSYPVFQALYEVGKLKNCGVLHFDAHTDLLESRYGIDICFGTWTSHALKFFSNTQSWVQVGIRASRKPKKYWENKFGLKQFWAKEVIKTSANDFSKKIIAHYKKNNCKSLYITNDIDGLSSLYCPSTGTPEPHGLNLKWVTEVITKLSLEFNLIGADLTEVAPPLGSNQQRLKTLDSSFQIFNAHNWS